MRGQGLTHGASQKLQFQRNLAASQAAAGRVIAASVDAFRPPAKLTSVPPCSMNEPQQPGPGTKANPGSEHPSTGQPRRDAQRADRAESLVPDEHVHKQDSVDLDQAWTRPPNGDASS